MQNEETSILGNYYETQKFNKWWMRLIFIVPVSFTLYGILDNSIHQPVGWQIVIAPIIIAAVGVLFYFINLETRIDEMGITIRFFPFQRVYYFVKWEEIETCAIRKYKPIMEYGGWGLRYSFTNGKAYNIAGKKGLQLNLKSGKKFLIGTQNAIELDAFLQRLKEEKGISCIASK